MEVINKTVTCHLADGITYEVNSTLMDFEENFSDRTDFIKTHRAYLVNLGCIQAIHGSFVVAKNGHHFIESVWGQGYRFVPVTK